MTQLLISFTSLFFLVRVYLQGQGLEVEELAQRARAF